MIDSGGWNIAEWNASGWVIAEWNAAGWNITDWIYRYYIHPIIYDTSYNPVDTITWGLLLGLAVLGLVRLFRRYNLVMDERLVLSTLPYILAGSSLRVVEDARLIEPPWSYLLITPSSSSWSSWAQPDPWSSPEGFWGNSSTTATPP